MKHVQLGKHTLKVPIIQGGMGVGVSLSSLAGNVMKQGGMGVISAAHPGYRKEDFWKDSVNCNCEALKEEIQKAKAMSEGNGLCGVNVMVASKNYDTYVKASIEGGADVIISGAGIPLDLPGLVEEGADVLLAPIVSSGKTARLIAKAWDRHYHRIPDFIVIEGSLAGGHLGFRVEELQNGTCATLQDILQDVQKEMKPYEEAYGRSIPLFVAGGIFDGKDIAEMINLGASGVQMATRFIATHECDANDAFKQQFIQATKEDVQLVKSPAGLPGRALRTTFSDEVKQARLAPKRCITCMKPCVPATTPYCISDALIAAVQGNIDHGLVFAGANAYRIDKLMSVKDLIDELIQECEENL